MLTKKEIEVILKRVNDSEGEFQGYNSIYLLGIKTGLEIVLEIKKPKARPA